MPSTKRNPITGTAFNAITQQQSDPTLYDPILCGFKNMAKCTPFSYWEFYRRHSRFLVENQYVMMDSVNGQRMYWTYFSMLKAGLVRSTFARTQAVKARIKARREALGVSQQHAISDTQQDQDVTT